MMTLAIIGVIVGITLGLQFRVFVLIPTIAIALVVITCLSVAGEHGVWWLILSMTVVATALQLGYLAGSAASLPVASTHVANRRRFWSLRAISRR